MRLIGDQHGNLATAYGTARKIEPLSMWIGVHRHPRCRTAKCLREQIVIANEAIVFGHLVIELPASGVVLLR